MTTSVEITQNAVALERIADAIDKITTNSNRMTKSQGATRTAVTESREAIMQMATAMNNMSSGVAGMTRSIEALASTFVVTFGQMGTQISNQIANSLGNVRTPAAKAGADAGKAFGDGFDEGSSKGADKWLLRLKTKVGTTQMLGDADTRENADKWLANMRMRATQGEIQVANQAALNAETSRFVGIQAQVKAATDAASGSYTTMSQRLRLSLDDRYAQMDPRAQYRVQGRVLRGLDSGQSADALTQSFGQSAVAAAQATGSLSNLSAQVESLSAKKAKMAPLTQLTNTNLQSFALHANDARSAARGLASGFDLLWLTWGRMGPLLAGAAISNAFVQTIKQGSEVNHTLETMRVLAQYTTADTAALTSQMLEMARSGPIGPQAIAEGMKTLALAGQNATDASYAIRDVLNLSVAGDVDSKKAAEALTGIATAFNLDARSFSYVGDVIAKTAATSKASVESITEAMKTASVVHKEYGVSLEDVALGVAMLNNLNIGGSSAGTALRNMYVDMSGRSKSAQDAMDKLKFSALDENTKKFKDLLTLAEEYTVAINKIGDAQERQRLRHTLTSERGGKLIVEASDALAKPAEDQKKYGGMTRAQEMRAEIEDHFGFMAQAAAELALTSKNQMMSVTSSWQAALVEAFTSAQPYILDVSTRLREMFQSSEMQSGLQKLIVGIGETIVFLVKWADVLAVVGAGWVALKLSMFAGSQFTQLAMGIQTSTSAMLGLKTAVDMTAMSKMNMAQQVTTVGAAMTTAATGTSAFASAMTTAATGVASTIAWISRFLPVIGLAITAWQLYDLFSGKALESAQSNLAENTAKAMIDRLEKETKALNDKSEALRRNISLEDLLRERDIGKAKSDAKSSREALQAKRDRMDLPSTGNEPFSASTGYNRVQGKADLDAQIADLIDLEKKLDLQIAGHKLASKEVAEATKYNQALNAPKNQFGNLSLKDNITGAPYLGYAKKDLSSALQEISSSYASQRRLIDAEEKAGLRTHAEAVAASVKSIEDEYNEKVATINQGTAKELEALGKMKVKDLAAAKEAIYNSQGKALRDAARTEDERARLARYEDLKRYREATTGEYNKIVLAMDKHDAQLAENALPTVFTAGMTDVEAAGAKAKIEYLKKYADELVGYNKVVTEAQNNERMWSNLLAESETASNRTSWEDAVDNRIKAEANKQALIQRREVGAEMAKVNAMKTQRENDIKQFTADTSAALTSSITTSLLKGGKEGGQKLRNYLQEALLERPLTVIVKGMMDNLLGGVGGGIMSSLGGSLAKGDIGGLFSGLFGGGVTSDSGASAEVMALAGFASGGSVNPRSVYEVNERGTELLSMGGRDYLMTGANSGVITPAEKLGGMGGVTISQNLVVNIDSRSDQGQIRALVGQAVQAGNARLVDQLEQSGALQR